MYSIEKREREMKKNIRHKKKSDTNDYARITTTL